MGTSFLIAIAGVIVATLGSVFFIIRATESDYPVINAILALLSFVIGFIILASAITMNDNMIFDRKVEQCITNGGSYVDKETGQCYDESRRLINTDLVPVTG